MIIKTETFGTLIITITWMSVKPVERLLVSFNYLQIDAGDCFKILLCMETIHLKIPKDVNHRSG